MGHIPFVFKYLGSDPTCTCQRPFKPETKENDTQPQYIERLIWTIDQAGDAAWRQSIAESIDLPKFIRHLAIESFLAEEDGITGDYGPNNFYFYRYENKSLFQFIPWDKSNTFWEAPSPNYFILRNVEDGPVDHRNRLVQRALKYPDLWALFLDTLEECANSASAGATTGANPQPGWLAAEIQREYLQIRDAALADTLISRTRSSSRRSRISRRSRRDAATPSKRRSPPTAPAVRCRSSLPFRAPRAPLGFGAQMRRGAADEPASCAAVPAVDPLARESHEPVAGRCAAHRRHEAPLGRRRREAEEIGQPAAGTPAARPKATAVST